MLRAARLRARAEPAGLRGDALTDADAALAKNDSDQQSTPLVTSRESHCSALERVEEAGAAIAAASEHFEDRPGWGWPNRRASASCERPFSKEKGRSRGKPRRSSMQCRGPEVPDELLRHRRSGEVLRRARPLRTAPWRSSALHSREAPGVRSVSPVARPSPGGRWRVRMQEAERLMVEATKDRTIRALAANAPSQTWPPSTSSASSIEEAVTAFERAAEALVPDPSTGLLVRLRRHAGRRRAATTQALVLADRT